MPPFVPAMLIVYNLLRGGPDAMLRPRRLGGRRPNGKPQKGATVTLEYRERTQ